ncbi:hypothetical protein [uncultured Herbaspirillum sp.]|uniref:hypothetical protein n=1 Tax=uncultured Herbaspirillum sp. TaxID=160236 RepID=UPI002583D491|nr:hypothetical protein [uncultured Herbaspirillum sp.]
MKSYFALPLLSMLGIACGSAVGRLNTAFIANCGESCPGDPLLWALGCFLAFPAIGHVIRRKTRHTFANTALIALGLAAIVLLPALALYGYDLHKGYWRLYAKQVHPDIEYSLMVIAEVPLPSLGIAEAERCAINTDTRCDQNPEAIPALCQSGFVSLPRQHWSSFKRLPKEDLRGAAPDDEEMNSPKYLCQK